MRNGYVRASEGDKVQDLELTFGELGEAGLRRRARGAAPAAERAWRSVARRVGGSGPAAAASWAVIWRLLRLTG